MSAQSKYEERFCKMLIDHMKTGKSFDSFGAVANVGRQTMYDWCEVHPEWKEAKSIAEMKALEFFESRLIAQITGQKVSNFDHKLSNPTLLIFAMKTRFHKVYGEKKPDLDDEDELEFTR